MGTTFPSHEIAAMRRALELAARGGRDTSPNPQVGCVLLDPTTGNMIGEGWHRRAGAPHAEVEALRDAGEDARGSTAVVTLEPCDHTGRTGPCTLALQQAGVARVVYAVADPASHAGSSSSEHVEPADPLSDGTRSDGVGTAGARSLAAAGIDVAVGLLADEAIALNREWFIAAGRNRPYLTYKYAATLDGRVAAADGSSRWISSPEARADAHRLRAESDAVLVGSGTARVDDPQLAVRGVPDARQPLRVVVDSEAAVVRPGARVLDDAASTLIAVAADLEDAATAHLLGRAEVLRVPRAPGGGLDPFVLLEGLHRRGVVRLLLEGGPTLAGSMIRAGVVDRVRGYVAPVLLGSGRAALGELGVDTLADAPRMRIVQSVPLGPDLCITADLPTQPTQPTQSAQPAQSAQSATATAAEVRPHIEYIK